MDMDDFVCLEFCTLGERKPVEALVGKVSGHRVVG